MNNPLIQSAQQAARPLHEMFGGGRRASIPLYANINRGTVPRTPAQFATRALRAASQGFRGIKLAPFDGVTPGAASQPQRRRRARSSRQRPRV